MVYLYVLYHLSEHTADNTSRIMFWPDAVLKDLLKSRLPD